MISMIVPVFNEEENIRNTLEELKAALEKLADYEIIVVNDGSTDNTYQIIAQIEGIKIVSYRNNRGKGYALRQGIRQSRGQIVGYIDGDGEISPRYIPQFYEELRDTGTDIVVAKKQNLKRSIPRKLYSLGFRIICHYFFGLSVDTQTGLKMFRKQVKNFSVQDDYYLFDLELLLACKENKLKIKEVPVRISACKKAGRIGWRQAMSMFGDLIRLKTRRPSGVQVYQAVGVVCTDHSNS